VHPYDRPINRGESLVKHVVSIDTAALLIDASKRTLWRRLSAGKLQRHSMDERGRVMLALADIAEHFCVPLSLEPAGGGGAKKAIRYWKKPTGGKARGKKTKHPCQ